MSFFDETVNSVKDVPARSQGMRVPLSQARKGDTVCVVKISGKDETKKHLSDLGFVLGAEVTVVSEVQGNFVCEVKGVRVALDHTLAQRITVMN